MGLRGLDDCFVTRDGPRCRLDDLLDPRLGESRVSGGRGNGCMPERERGMKREQMSLWPSSHL